MKISPYSYLQEELRAEPWKVLVACIMLNQTGYKQVRQVIWTFFERWPTPKALAAAEPQEIVDLIRPLGFQNRRARSLIEMARRMEADPDWTSHPGALPGIGKYALDSWSIFVRDDLSVTPSDKELIRYLEWRHSDS